MSYNITSHYQTSDSAMTTIDPSLKIDYTKFYLPNGIKCILYQRDEIHSVHVRVTVNVGALDETNTTNGLSHFIEHVAAGDGTKDLPNWEEIDRYKNEYSGSTNAYTTYDHTQYYGTFPHQYLEQAIYFASQQVLHPLLKSEDVEKERTIILDEMRRYNDDIHFQVFKNIKNNRFKDKNTPYSSEIIGTKENLETFTKVAIEDFYHLHYIPSNIEVFIVGNLDVDEAKKYIETYFIKDTENGIFAEKQVRAFKKEYPEYADFSINAVQKRDIDQYYLTINFPAPEFSLTTAEERNKTAFLQTITASGQFSQSILWKRLREELNLVYGVNAFTQDYLYTRNMFTILVAFNKENLETILKEIYSGLNKIKQGDITDSVFKSRKKKVLDTQLMQLDKPSNVLDWIESFESELEEHGKAPTLKDYLEYIQAEKFENIITHAQEVFDWNKAQIGIVSQDDSFEVEKIVKDIWTKIVRSDSQVEMKM